MNFFSGRKIINLYSVKKNESNDESNTCQTCCGSCGCSRLGCLIGTFEKARTHAVVVAVGQLAYSTCVCACR